MVTKKIIFTLLFLGAIYLNGFGQIKYKITLLNGKDLYQVSLVSSQDFNYPNNIVGSAQISIKAPIASFQLGTVESLMEGIVWENNAAIVSPIEAKEAQYFSFSLKSTGVSFSLKKGLELPLFTFKNELGSCAGTVSLVDNNDVFLPPNSRNANIGNQITPFGCLNLSNKNAYTGNIASGIADCFLSTSITDLTHQPSLELALSPNPAEDWLNITINTNDLKEAIELQLWQTDGQLIRTEKLTTGLGKRTQLELAIDALPAGIYSLNLVQGTHTVTRNFVKVLR